MSGPVRAIHTWISCRTPQLKRWQGRTVMGSRVLEWESVRGRAAEEEGVVRSHRLLALALIDISVGIGAGALVFELLLLLLLLLPVLLPVLLPSPVSRREICVFRVAVHFSTQSSVPAADKPIVRQPEARLTDSGHASQSPHTMPS